MKTKLTLLLSLITFFATAQNFNKDKMDTLFMLIDKYDKGMGSLSIFHDGKEVYQNATGYASVEDNIPATPETEYRAGSVSKIYTATIIMKLVEDKQLSLDEKLASFYPDIENAAKITIEHLLQHRSGIFNFTSAKNYQKWMEQKVTPEQLIDTIRSKGSVFEPGEKMEYSNSNYVLLTYIAEKVTGKDFGQLLREIIFEPCNLTNTEYGDKIEPKKNEAYSYARLNSWSKETETDMSVPSGAGAIVSTPAEINRFLNCLFAGKLVKKESVDKMTTMKDKYGYGIFQIPFHDKRALGHTGGIDGFRASAFYFPEEKLAVTYLGNGIDMPVNDILIGVLSIYFGREDYKLPEFSEKMKVSVETLNQYAGVYSGDGFPLKVTISVKRQHPYRAGYRTAFISSQAS
ncbi:MAG: serine hydrolase domain-containing protein [Bacteroidales bacterium]|nr:serine hydrolase domain-containing protein [Bacteroidales bacterium]